MSYANGGSVDILPAIGSELVLEGDVLGVFGYSSLRKGCICGMEELHQDNRSGSFVEGGKWWEGSNGRSGVYDHDVRFGSLGLGAKESRG